MSGFKQRLYYAFLALGIGSIITCSISAVVFGLARLLGWM